MAWIPRGYFAPAPGAGSRLLGFKSITHAVFDARQHNAASGSYAGSGIVARMITEIGPASEVYMG